MDDFNRLNRFPGDMMFQTFLLNKSNKVLAIGNPVLNPQIKKLYLSLIAGTDAAEPTDRTLTSVSVNHTELDFGSFPKEEKQERSFVLTNTGQGLLVI